MLEFEIATRELLEGILKPGISSLSPLLFLTTGNPHCSVLCLTLNWAGVSTQGATGRICMLACWSDRIVQNNCSGLASFSKQVDLRYLSPKLQCWKCLLAFCLTWEKNTDFFPYSIIHQAPLLYVMTCLEWIWVVQPINGQNRVSVLFVNV